MASHRELVDILSLNINIENPRFEMVSNQREAIKTMIEDQKEKLIKLADPPPTTASLIDLSLLKRIVFIFL